jgi:YD repeat-containing protein
VALEVTAEGTRYTSFDERSRPTAGETPGGQSFSITYGADGSFVEKFADGTVETFDPSGKLTGELLPDGTRYTSFDEKNRPTAGTTPNGDPFSIDYRADGSFTEQFASGTTETFDRSGRLSAESMPDGTRFTSFDGQGRPTGGLMPNGTGFALTYNTDRSSVETFTDGSRETIDPTGKVLTQTTADGTRFADFDGAGRPHSGVLANGTRFTMSYPPGGGVVDYFADGSSTQFDPGGNPVRQVTADGTVFTSFDGQGRPTAGTSGGMPFTMGYGANGASFERMADGTVTEFDAQGRPTRTVTPDGTQFTSFDSRGRPTGGITTDGSHFGITYDDKGDVFQHAPDGSVTEFGPDGRPIKTWTPDGVEIDWAVDLAALHAAAGGVAAQRDQMQSSIAGLRTVFEDIAGMWRSPAGKNFEPVRTDFNKVTDTLTHLLDEAVDRMYQSYANYAGTEQTNTRNLK